MIELFDLKLNYDRIEIYTKFVFEFIEDFYKTFWICYLCIIKSQKIINKFQFKSIIIVEIIKLLENCIKGFQIKKYLLYNSKSY